MLINTCILRWCWNINTRWASYGFIWLKLGLCIRTRIYCSIFAIWNNWSGLWLICLSLILDILWISICLIRCTCHRPLVTSLVNITNSKLISIHLLRSFLVDCCSHSSWNSSWANRSFSFLIWSRLNLSWSSFIWILLRLLLLLLRNRCCSILV